MATTITIRPNGDASPNAWSARPTQLEYDYMHIDDPIGDEPDGYFLQAGKNEDLDEENFNMESVYNVRLVLKITVYGYGMYESYNGWINWSPNVRLYWAGNWTSTKRALYIWAVYVWKSLEWDGLSGTQDDLDNLLVDFIALNGMGILDYFRLESTYTNVEVLWHEDERKHGQRINFGINHGIS